MTFKKPPGLKYTDMAIYIDEHVYTKDCNENLVYEYLYHIINMLARKSQFFKTAAHYDAFALQSATRAYLRLKSIKQFQFKDDGVTTKLKPIKSILNYLKTILYPMKIEYEQSNYSQCISKSTGEAYATDFNYIMSRYVDNLSLSEFNIYLEDIAKTTRAFLKRIPYYSDKKVWENIYISCLLTLLNSITLSNANKQRIIKYENDASFYKDFIIDRVYKEEQKNCIILYHLESSFKDYIIVLVNSIKHLISTDLCELLHSHIGVEDNTKNILLSSIYEGNEYEDKK